MNGEIFEEQVNERNDGNPSMPHVGLSLSNLSKMEKSDREYFLCVEEDYKAGVSKGDDESLFLLMRLYNDANEKNALLGLLEWVRDRDNDIEKFLDFAASYLPLICISAPPLPKEVIYFLLPYYEDIKKRILDSNEWSEDPVCDNSIMVQHLDAILLEGRHISSDCVH